MMFIALLSRIFRSKVLVTLCLFSVIYLFLILLWSSGTDDLIENESDTIIRPKEFRWATDELLNDSTRVVTTCRNSIQGKVFLADDQGYVCHRKDQLSTGCCNIEVEATQKYSCDTCNDNGCCAIYEYCVSCCLNPDKKMLLKRVLGLIGDNSPLYASVSDHFELCLVKCRTSSESVQHETLYRDPKTKHCYGEWPPPIVSNET